MFLLRYYQVETLISPFQRYFNPSGEGAILVSQIVPRSFYTLNSTLSVYIYYNRS